MGKTLCGPSTAGVLLAGGKRVDGWLSRRRKSVKTEKRASLETARGDGFLAKAKRSFIGNLRVRMGNQRNKLRKGKERRSQAQAKGA